MSATEYVDVDVPRVLADLLVGPEEPPRMIRPPAETVDEVARWLWLQAHEWSRTTDDDRQRAAEGLCFWRWLADRRRRNGR